MALIDTETSLSYLINDADEHSTPRPTAYEDYIEPVRDAMVKAWQAELGVSRFDPATGHEDVLFSKSDNGLYTSMGPVAVASDGPRTRVHDAESFRGPLLKLWAKRARDLAAEAQSAAAPLQITDCQSPGRVEQRPVSLEEVGLNLSVNCRLDVLLKR